MLSMYPAIFFKEKDEGYSVVFPDLPGCITQGDNLVEAIEMAEDAALGWLLIELENGNDIPTPTKMEEVELESENSFVNLVLLDLGLYSKKHSDNKYIKKTLTVPCWLNEIAEKKGINFSKTLQEALLQKTYKK